MVLSIAVAVGIAAPRADAGVPSPVYAPSGGIADPGIVRTNGNFYAFASGSLAPLFVGDEAGGPWSAAGHALASAGAWATSNAIWAPDAGRSPMPA